MPKRSPRHNPESARLGTKSVSNSRTPARVPLSVNTLLSRVSQSALGRVAHQRQAQEDWRLWLKNRLSSDIDAHITGVTEGPNELTVFADSAAWSARLKFAMAEIEEDIRVQNAAIRKVIVKVLPRRGPAR